MHYAFPFFLGRTRNLEIGFSFSSGRRAQVNLCSPAAKAGQRCLGRAIRVNQVPWDVDIDTLCFLCKGGQLGRVGGHLVGSVRGHCPD